VTPRHARFSISATVLSLIVAISLASGQIVRDQRGSGIVDRGVVVSNFSREEVKRMAQDFLQSEAKDTSIARLLIAPDQPTLLANYYHGTLHNTYESTVAEIEHAGMPKGPMARVLAIRGRAKLSYLEKGVLTEEMLFGSSDPTIFRDGNYSYELLHFVLTQSHLRGNPYFLTLYLKASPSVSITSLSRIYSALHQLTTIDELRIEIRRDPWFLETQQYPAVPVFTRPLEIPNSVHYIIGPAVSCSLMDRKFNCAGRNFGP
jgi:hypothetical protein